MAEKTSNEELKRQAIAALAEGRAGIGAGLRHARERFTPARVIHRGVDRHPTLAVVLAFTAGIIPALSLFRGKQQLPERWKRPVSAVTHAPPKPLLGAVAMGALGLLGKSLLPSLLKSAILPRVLESLAGKWQIPPGPTPPRPGRP
ncbi:MAG: hypothetical protein V4584_04185 [Verrucomicrobiota bacterium]